MKKERVYKTFEEGMKETDAGSFLFKEKYTGKVRSHGNIEMPEGVAVQYLHLMETIMLIKGSKLPISAMEDFLAEGTDNEIKNKEKALEYYSRDE